MSEEKVIQHTKKAVKTLGDKHKKIAEKIKDFLLEIFIIVIAVSITLWFHNWNDSRHEKELATQFLIGIREDLKQEAENIQIIIKDFQPTVDYYNTVSEEILENRIDAKYLDENSEQLTNTLYFVFDNSRFESFKSSGYLRLIENQELLKHLVTLYTKYLPFHQDQIDKNIFGKREIDYDTYIGTKGVIDSTGTHVSRLMNDPPVRYQFIKYARSFNERKQQQKNLLKAVKDMIAELDKELNK